MAGGSVAAACQITAPDAPSIPVWAESRGLRSSLATRCVRASLSRLDGEWAWELHQFLANSGQGSLLYRISGDPTRPLSIGMGDFRAPFGRGLAVSVSVSSAERAQLGASLLTAFMVVVSQGADPAGLRMAQLADAVKELDLPVLGEDRR